RDRLGQARLPRLRPVEGNFVAKVPAQGLLRGAGRKGEAARPGVIPLVLGEPQEGRAGSATAAVRLYRGISARAADAVGQARIRVQQPQAFPRSRTAADRQVRAVMGRAAFRRAVRALSAAAFDATLEI